MKNLSQEIVALISGFLFALGLGISEMTQPQKIIGFLDISNWDPSLLFVMAGAVTVHGLAYLILKNKKRPLLDSKWHIPPKQPIRPTLIIGATVFGLGWGLGGYCPGPALTAMGSLSPSVFGFVLAMIAGMISYDIIFKVRRKS